MIFFQCQSILVQKTKTDHMTSLSEWWEQWTTCLQVDFSFSRYRKLKKINTRTCRFYEIKRWWFPSVLWNYIICIVLLQVIWWRVRPGKLVLNLVKSVNHITSASESVWKRVKTFVGVKMVFTEVISKLSWQQNFAVIRRNLITKFRGLIGTQGKVHFWITLLIYSSLSQQIWQIDKYKKEQ